MAHTLDTSASYPATATSTNNANPVTTTYTCGAGTTVLCVMILYAGSTARSGGAPTYNSVALTQADQQRYGSSGPECSVEVWYLLDPPTGSSYTLNVPNSGTLATKVHIASAKAAAGKSSALDNAAGNGAVGTNPTVDVATTVNGDVIFNAVANGAQSWGASGQTGTVIQQGDLGTWGGGAQYLLQANYANPTTMSWTFGTSEDYGIISAAFKETDPPARTVVVAAAALTAGGQTITVSAPSAPVSVTLQAAALVAIGPAIVVALPQSARPISDISTGGWTPSSGGSLYAMIDEAYPDDNDWIRSASNPSADVCEVRLAPLNDPQSGLNHKIRVRYDKEGGATIQLTISLIEGTTVRAQFTQGNLPDELSTIEFALSQVQADSIVDYTNLRIRFEATAS